jgi:hypothetical protein
MWARRPRRVALRSLPFPVYARADEQLHRVADAAVLRRYEQLDGPAAQKVSGRP